MEWQWHQLDHMQIICSSLQTDNRANTSSLKFYRPDALLDVQPTVSKHWRQLTAVASITLWANERTKIGTELTVLLQNEILHIFWLTLSSQFSFNQRFLLLVEVWPCPQPLRNFEWVFTCQTPFRQRESTEQILMSWHLHNNAMCFVVGPDSRLRYDTGKAGRTLKIFHSYSIGLCDVAAWL